jgi:hypothetical protein
MRFFVFSLLRTAPRSIAAHASRAISQEEACLKVDWGIRLFAKDRLETIGELQLHLMALIVHEIESVSRDVRNLRGPGDFGGEILGYSHE